VAALPERLTAALADRYSLLRELGAGGMATVYLANDLRHDREVAVKVLRPELAATLGPERFGREIQIAAKLQHPHILPLLDSGQAGGFLYYVMPFIEGESLRQRLTRVRELPIPEAVRLLRDVADALSLAHARGVVHRDIKPENVMLTGRHALVTDFGVAKAVSEAKGETSLTTAGVALGTPAYMSPEQAAADPNVDHRADLYALGAMGYELVAGRPPFVGTTPQQLLAMHVTQEPDPVSRFRPGVPPALEALLMRCLAKRAADRPQTADEVLERLESLGGTPSGGITPTQTQPTQAVALDPGYGHPLRVAGLFALATVAVLGVVYFLTIQLGLPDWVPWGALGLMAAGLPIMVVTGLVERRRAQQRATGMWSASGETGLHRHVTWKRATRGGVMAFTALAVVAAGYTAMRVLGIGPVGTLVASGKLDARDKIVVADFRNSTADSTLGASISEAFRIDLAQSPVMTVMTSSVQAAALARMGRDPLRPLDQTVAREMAQREGAKAIVAGEISPVGRGFVLAARLLAASDGAELVAIRETAEDDGQILPALDRLSKRVRERVGESLRTIRAGDPLEQVTTSSMEALQLYSRGVQAANVNDNEKAAALLRQAVAVDSGFAMAWRKLAVVISNDFGSQTDVVDAATRAYRHRSRLPELERHLTTAYYFNTADFDRARVEAAYRAALAVDPDNAASLNNLGIQMEERGAYATAETLFAHAVRVGSFIGHREGLFRNLVAQGKETEARAVLDDMRRAFPQSSAPLQLETNLLFATGAWDSAQKLATRALVATRDPADRAGLTLTIAAGEQVQGRLRQAERAYRDNMAINQARGLSGSVLAGALSIASMQVWLTRDTVLARQQVEDAVTRYPLASIPAADRPYSFLAAVYAQLGQTGRARQLLKEYEAQVPEGIRRGDPGRHAAAGFIAAAEGRTAEALGHFRAWRSEPTFLQNGAGFGMATLMEQAGMADSALALYEALTARPKGITAVFEDRWSLAASYERQAALYEARGERDKALDAWSRFVELWKDADPVLQPRVRDARERMARLAGESR
jgi:tetratricopeptide (TPR) repeat protein